MSLKKAPVHFWAGVIAWQLACHYFPVRYSFLTNSTRLRRVFCVLRDGTAMLFRHVLEISHIRLNTFALP